MRTPPPAASAGPKFEDSAEPPLPEIDFSRFYRHEELGDLLHAFVQARPKLLRLASMGRSHEGRALWILTLTRFAHGDPRDKPAFWVDGNIHAGELLASTAVLHFMDYLLRGDGNDPLVTHLIDTRCFYLAPRLCPDGAELALAERPRHIRSSTRRYPLEDEALEGLSVEDVDGDGRILSMRIADPHGGWKPHPEDPRVMIPRAPGEIGGSYYRILPEGRLRHHRGQGFAMIPDAEGLDLNRNFPPGWRQEYQQLGAGPYPASEPEVRAVLDFVVQHPNIGAAVSFHTHSGVILRPMGTEADEKMIPEDLWMIKRLSDEGARQTGYPAISIWHEFRYHPQQVISGTQDWFYEHLGALFWVVELWSPNRAAGIDAYPFIDWYREHPASDDLKLLRWSDAQCAGQAHVDWRPFAHPELGPVEIGGWDRLNFWRNPPPALREAEVARFSTWLRQLAAVLPRLELVEATQECLGEAAAGDGTGANPAGFRYYRVRMTVRNTGYLPTYVTRRALERKTVRGVVFEIAPLEPGTDGTLEARLQAGSLAGPRDAIEPDRIRPRLLGGRQRSESPGLEGHAPRSSLQAFLPDAGVGADRCGTSWDLAALPGTRLRLIARSDRAGRVVKDLELC
ncbi:MAG: M14 family metallopeptidase [Betaproteobacteria bacterium]